MYNGNFIDPDQHVHSDQSHLQGQSLTPATRENGGSALCISSTASGEQLSSYILVGDNVDFSVTPTYMRSDKQKQLLHYFQFCAIKDRLDLSSLSSTMKTDRPTLDDVMSAVKVTAEERESLLSNYIILISRILIDNMSYFHLTYSDLITAHIKHKYSQEMSKESEVVSKHK